jgi:hypothetical protein
MKINGDVVDEMEMNILENIAEDNVLIKTKKWKIALIAWWHFHFFENKVLGGRIGSVLVAQFFILWVIKKEIKIIYSNAQRISRNLSISGQ